ncbi:MAG: aromatic amino acid lyase [Armatimonadetes bacterium]|nr:aromatic amino acid lyase [Armatimonadota bacterium]
MDESNHLDVSKDWNLDDVVAASRFSVRLDLPEARAKMLDESRQRVLTKLEGSHERLYGFNTGFGDNRNRKTVSPEARGVIQDNLIKSHASGFGDALPVEVVRAALAVRVKALALGHSAVRSEVVGALCDLYNNGLVPHVPTYGSVGASGDLAPLSHLALPLLGQGRVLRDGEWVEVSKELMESEGVRSLRYDDHSVLGSKEGLALNNGTAFMTAWLCLAAEDARGTLATADLALALGIEAMCGVMDAYDERVQALRHHHGVAKVASRVRSLLQDSDLVIRNGAASDAARRARTVGDDGVLDSVQDDYSLRAGSVVHGTASDAIGTVAATAFVEINSVTDNPVVVDSDTILSGAHFHGMPLAFAADQLRTAMAIVAGISERRVAKLMNDKRNYGLPRHLVMDDPDGVKSGWMIAQYCAASMVNELKTRSMPYCVGNVTTGNESEDFVSMGANACRAAYECASVFRGIVAIELAAAVRALLIRVGCPSPDDDLSGTGLSAAAQHTIEAFWRAGIPVSHTDDRPLEPIFAQTAELIEGGDLTAWA